MTPNEIIDELVSKARAAQREYETYSQSQVDELVRAIAKTVFDNAEPLARMAVDETGMGVYEDKIKKNMGKARVIWNELKGKKSVGIINDYPELGITEVAKPMGVVGAVTPTTNPIVTPMCNAMFALKGRNAIIICPHPRSRKCSAETVRLMNESLDKLGAPKNLIQIIEEPTVEHIHGRSRYGKSGVRLRQAGLWRGRGQCTVSDRRGRGYNQGNSHDRGGTAV